jgi:hypothetical protein
MLKKTAILFINILLLLSMTEMSKVAMLGYTLFSDGDKAAMFCTCIGCSHNAASQDRVQSCSIDMDGAGHDDKAPSHCSINASGDDAPSICACGAEPGGEHHILLNSLDKIALLFPSEQSAPGFDSREYFHVKLGLPDTFTPDIFHPPRS